MEQLLEFAGNHPFLVLGLVAMTALVVVNELRLLTSGTAVEPAEAVRLINQDAAVLDLRGKTAWEKARISGARHAPPDELSEAVKDLERDRPVLAYCDTGAQGGKAAARLRKEGFGQAYNLKGGLAAWERENLPLERGKAKGRRRAVVPLSSTLNNTVAKRCDAVHVLTFEIAAENREFRRCIGKRRAGAE